MIMKTKESEEIFDRGINYFRAGFYSSALNEFYQVKKIAPDYPNIDYIIEAAIKKNDEVAGGEPADAGEGGCRLERHGRQDGESR